MKIKPLSFVKSDSKTWDDVFHNSRPVNVESFKTGTVMINRRGSINPDHPLAPVMGDEELEVPILVHWVRHEKYGDFLLDAGLDSSYYHDPCGGLKGTAVDEYRQEEDEKIAHYLTEHHINLEMVFISHLHSDHAAGIRELPKDILYVTGKGEYSQYHVDVHGDFLEGLDKLYEIDYTRAQIMPYLGSSVDLLGDGSLWAIHTPGHTPGHSSFLVNGLNGLVLLTMDAAFIQENLELGVAPCDYTWDVGMAQESLEKIIEFLKVYPQVRVGVGHEVLK